MTVHFARPLSIAIGVALGYMALPATAFPSLAADEVIPSSATLDKVVVKGQRGSDLDQRASGATRLGVSIIDTPAAVTVVGRSQMDERGVRTTQEALFAVPGLAVASPPGHGNTVSWRGFGGSQISQMFNGIDVKYATIAARPVDAWMYERVEAIGGPASFLYGAGAVGGAINYVTRLANFEKDDTGGLLRLGSQKTAVLAGGFNHRFGGDDARQALRVDVGHSQREGWADNERREGRTLAASLTSRIGGRFTHTLALEYQNEDNRRIYWGSPAVASAAGRMNILPGTAGRNYNVADGFYGQEVIWARSVSEWALGNGGQLTNTLYHYDALRDYRNVEVYRYNLARDGVIRSGVLQQRHDQAVYGNRLDWNWSGQWAGRPSQWTAGLDLSYNRQTRFPQSIGGDVDTVPVDARTPGSYFDIPGTFRHHIPGATNRVHTQALSVENMTWLTPKLGLMTGLRHERIGLAVQNHRAPTATSPARWQTRYAPTTGRLGLNWKLDADTSLYAQYSTAADPPSGILSTGGFSVLRDFDLSRGRQFEMGAKTGFDDGRGSATLAAYRIVRSNLTIADPNMPGQTQPVGQQSSRGIEATVEWRPLEAWRVQANVGWVDASLDDFYENIAGVPVSRAGNTPANTPGRVANLWIDHAFNSRWSSGVDARFVASRYANNANTLKAAGYGLWGAYVRLKASQNLTLTARGRNLGDREYVLHAIGSNMVYMGEPRSLELELRAQF